MPMTPDKRQMIETMIESLIALLDAADDGVAQGVDAHARERGDGDAPALGQ